MFGRRLQARFWSISIIAVVAALGTWAWRSSQPMAKLTLADGSEHHLLGATFQSQFRTKSPLSANAGLWQRIRHTFSAPTGSITLQGKGPHFVFSSRSSKLARDSWISGIRTTLNDHDPIERNLSSSNGYVVWDEAVFPRREKTFHVQVKIGDQWHDWVLPNPLYGKEFPTWTAEEFPIKRAVGSFEYEMKAWKPGNFGPYLPFELWHKGKPVKWPVVISSSRIYTDATGNESQKLLSSQEAAWKVRHSVTAGKQAPLSSEHSVRFPKMKVPHPGEQGMSVVEGIPATRGKKHLGYAGIGAFQFTGGAPVALDAERAAEIAKETEATASAPRISFSKDGASWTLTGAFKKPVFLIVDEDREQKRKCEYGYWRGGEWTQLHTRVQSGDSVGRRSLDVRVLSPDEPAGTELDVHIFWPETFEVEMFVKPPPIGMGALKK